MTVFIPSRIPALPSIRGAWRAAFASFRGITRDDVHAAFLFACAYAVYDLVLNSRELIESELWLFLAIKFVFYQVGAFTLLLGATIADSIGDARLRRIAFAAAVTGSGVLISALLGWTQVGGDFDGFGLFTLLLSLVVARAMKGRMARRSVLALTIIFAVIMFVVGWQEFAGDPQRAKGAEAVFPLARHKFFEWLLLAGAAVFVYLDRRRTRAARAKMHAAEVDRARSAKRALESRLQAMQARVEPQFLFNTLAQVHDLYRTDPARGERMLDELIAYLRAAMPKMRDTSSTLGQEIELVRAYLAIVRVRLGERLAFEIESPADVTDARMPPMMLLPLVDHAIAHGLGASQANGTIRIRAAVNGRKIRLEIVDSGVGFLPGNEGDGIAGIRERLAALFESDAQLVLQTTDGGATEAAMEIPFEVAETRDD